MRGGGERGEDVRVGGAGARGEASQRRRGGGAGGETPVCPDPSLQFAHIVPELPMQATLEQSAQDVVFWHPWVVTIVFGVPNRLRRGGRVPPRRATARTDCWGHLKDENSPKLGHAWHRTGDGGRRLF